MLSRQRRILGEDHPDTLTSASQLGLLLWYLGDYRQARQLQDDTFTRSRRILGEDHPDTILSGYPTRTGHVVTRASISTPRQLQNDTLTRSRRILGEDHPTTLASAHVLGMILWSLGEYRRARQLQTDTFTRSRRILGEDQFITLHLASGLGLTLDSLGEHQLARRLHHDAFTRGRRILGEDHPITLRIASFLGLNLGVFRRAPGGPPIAERHLQPSPSSSGRGPPRTHCVRPAFSASPWGRWASISRLAIFRTTSSPATAGYSAPTTRKLSSRRVGSPPICVSWASTSKPEHWTRTPLPGSRRALGDDHPDTLILIAADNVATGLCAPGENQQAREPRCTQDCVQRTCIEART